MMGENPTVCGGLLSMGRGTETGMKTSIG